MPQRNVTLLLLAAAISYACYVRGEQNPYARYAATALATIEDNSLEPVPDRELFEAAMSGMVDVLHRHGDAHSQFFNEREREALLGEINQHFGGIGVRIHFLGKPQRLVIIAPPDSGTPAARARLAAGDQITAIDDEPTEKMSMDDVLVAMRGLAGEPLRLTVMQHPENKSRTVDLVREEITLESVIGDRRDSTGRWQFRLPHEPRIAHVRIPSFGNLTAQEVANLLDKQIPSGVEAVVLDVRDDSGGTLDAAVAVCKLFLPPERLIVETRGRDGTSLNRFITGKAGPYVGLPLAVLVNQNSASASEIVAACLQDHGRAAVVGQRSFGKGTVQQLIPMQSGKSLLKLSWASFWRPSGENIHRMEKSPLDGQWGVRPDKGFEIALSEEEYKNYRRYRTRRDMVDLPSFVDLVEDDLPAAPADFVDRQLAKAVEHLQKILNDTH